MKRIGIDLGGTKIEIMLTEENGIDVIERKRVPTNKSEGYRPLVKQIADLINEFQAKTDDELLIGIGIPGSISPKTGLVQNANTTCLIGEPLKADLESMVNHKVTVENDANCFALCEALLGAGKGYDLVLGIIMGTGMGGGIIQKGVIWEGINGNAGEWGHTCLDIHGPECWCGQLGCMEMYLSGTGIQRVYKEHAGAEKSLPDIYQDHLAKTDPHATQTIEDTIFNFGRCMANLVNIFDPDVIVIGGGASNLPILYDEGQESTNRQLFNKKLKVPILKNKMGDSSGIYGAAMLSGH